MAQAPAKALRAAMLQKLLEMRVLSTVCKEPFALFKEES
jgi:hypothetical protein